MRLWLHRHRLALLLGFINAWACAVGLPRALAAHGIGHARRSSGALTLAGCAPAIVAVAVRGAAEGRGAVANVWRQLRLGGGQALGPWYVGVVLAPLALLGLARLVRPLVGRPLPALGPWYTPFVATLVLVPLTGLFEEN